MKIKKVNKILASIMLFLILFSIIQPVFAASGSGKWSGGQYASGMKTTDNANGTTGVLIRRLNNLNTGERRTVFCAEHGIDFKTGASYNGIYYTPTNSNIRKACKVAYLGWYKNNGGYTVDGGILANDMKWVKWDYVFTQQYIWEILGQSNATFIKSDEQQGYIDFKNRINNEIADIEKRPSFNGSTITIQAGETKTITDSNGVLAEYGTIDNTKDGIRFVHQNGSNSMTIFVNENTNLENYRISDNTFKEWGMIKNGTEDNDTMVYFEFASGVQNQLYCMSYNDPVTLNFSLEIETFGRLELQKLNTNGDLVNGAVFKVRGANDYNKDVTVTNGKITIDKLKKGTYTINEISVPFGYLIDTKSYDVEVKVNQTATKAIVNEEPTGEIKAYKTDNYNNKLKGAEISLYAREDIKNVAGTITWYKKGELITKAITNDDGMAQFSNLHLGKYYVKETNAPNGYLVNSKEFDTELKYKDANTKVIYIDVTGIKDEEPTGKITIIKKDAETGSVPQGDATFNGAVYKVYANEDIYNKAKTKKFYSNGDLVATRTINEKGETEDIKNLPLGKYIVKEETNPTGYMLDKNTYSVELKYKDQYTKVIADTKTSLENVKKMGVHIFKSGVKENSGETPGLEGAEFTIKLNSAVERAYAQGYSYEEVWNGIDENGNQVKVDSKRVKLAQATIQTTIKTLKAIITTAKAIISAIIAGGWVAVVIILVIALIGGFIAAIFNSNGDADYDTSQIPISEIILVAKAQIGNEGGDKFWKWYGFEEHVHWCACYVSWCANECGYIEKGIIPKFSVCTDGINWFKEKNEWHDRGENYYPIIGDIIFFDWKDENGNQDGTSDHVGIVTRTDITNRNIYTIEGNTSNKCAERMYSFDDVQVMGYGSPKYE